MQKFSFLAPFKSKDPESHLNVKGYMKEILNRLISGGPFMVGALLIGLQSLKNPKLSLATIPLSAMAPIAEYMSIRKGDIAAGLGKENITIPKYIGRSAAFKFGTPVGDYFLRRYFAREKLQQARQAGKPVAEDTSRKIKRMIVIF